MPQAVAAAAPARQETGAAGGAFNFRSVVQSIALFIAVQAAVKFFVTPKGGTVTAPQTQDPTTGEVSPSVAYDKSAVIPAWQDRPSFNDIHAPYQPVPYQVAPIWPVDVSLDLKIYVSPSLVVPPLSSYPRESLVLDETKLVWNNWTDNREIETFFDVPRDVQYNATLWAHFFVAQTGSLMDPSAKGYDYAKAFHFVRPLTQYLAKKKTKKARNLLSSSTNTDETELAGGDDDATSTGPTVVQYYHSNFSLSLIPDTGVIAYSQLHPATREFIQLERTHARDATGANGWYYPTLFLNTFWQLRAHMTELNNTVTRLPLNIHLNRQANWKFNVMATMDFGMKQNAAKAAQGSLGPTGGDGTEMEQIKQVLLDSNPYLLATTFVVSIFHTIFEFLAFKNDVSHWRKKKDNVGVSFRTILANVFMQAIIFLYLIDNSESTSYMILIPQGLGILLEAWKITKTVDVRLRPTSTTSPPRFPFSLLPYQLTFEDKHKLSETEKKTQEYDQIAFRYLYLVAIPLLGAYAAYSLIYDSHKSWYSFTITTLVGSVYAYGFLMMVPSLYINYRLKSVAHLPGKAMTYKFLNTFIDDLFAFTIKMPTLHRLATLRDDVIFFVYLYQGWKYKTDYTRVNEFGQGGGDDDDEVEAEAVGDEQLDAKLASKPLTSPASGDVSGIEKVLAPLPVDGSTASVSSGSKGHKTSGRAVDGAGVGAAKKRK